MTIKDFLYKKAIFKIPLIVYIIIILGFIISSFLLYSFAEIAEEVFENETIILDQAVFDFLHSIRFSKMRTSMTFITETGSIWWITLFSIITVAYLLQRKRDKWVISIFIITNIAGGLLNKLLKIFFQRSRPEINSGIDAIGFSFPSGHAMGSMIFYGFIGYLLIRSQQSTRRKVYISIILTIFILLIGLSRIYLKAHYATDVLAGYLAGLFWLSISIYSLEITYWYKRRKKNKSIN